MVTKVQKWGNSQGLRFSKAVLEEAQIDIGEEVKISARQGRIIIEPVHKIRGKYDLKKLVARIPKEYYAEELAWGEAVGKEAW